MSLLIEYLLKLTISLAIVWLFYQFVLRRLTFYNSNRWYLLGCTLLSFLIPLINIAPIIDNSEGSTAAVVRSFPTVQQYTVAWEEVTNCPVPVVSTGFDKWDWMILGLIMGGGFFLLRFVIRCISFFRMRYKAKLISAGEVNLYQVDKDIIPFSFGNSIFINKGLHVDAELQEIIRHEFVHVKQKHTHDIIWGEWLCIINWYNPFAWLIRKAIRQNLEFIADNKVLENGFDKKQYQYLLLKVIGNHHFSIANQFNFSSLKKRIAMMNKMKSARSHLFKFFFMLPLVVVLLVAFRSNQTRQEDKPQEIKEQKRSIAAAPERVASKRQDKKPTVDTLLWIKDNGAFYINPVPKDTVPEELLNDKGYYIEIIDKKGECTVVVWSKNKKEIDRLLLTKWNANEAYYENLYGEILMPPPPPAPPTPPAPPAPGKSAVPGTPAAPSIYDTPDAPPTPAAPANLPKNVEHIRVTDKKASVRLKDGKTEEYDLTNEAEKKVFEEKYGPTPTPPPPPVIKVRSVRTVSVTSPVSTTVAVPVAVKTTMSTTLKRDIAINMKPTTVTTINVKPVTATVKTTTSLNAKVNITAPIHVQVEEQ